MTRAARLAAPAFLASLLGAFGCESSPTDTAAPSSPPVSPVASPSGPGITAAPAAKQEAAAPAADSAITLQKMSFNDFLAKVAKNPKAKFTVVDAWATWCAPCKENFPHLVEMNQKYGDKGVAFASVSFDDPNNAKHVGAAETFLREKKAAFTNVLLNEGDDATAGFEKLNINSIPAVFVYDSSGKEVKRFTVDDPNNQFTYDEVEKYVVALLEGKAPPEDKPAKKAD